MNHAKMASSYSRMITNCAAILILFAVYTGNNDHLLTFVHNYNSRCLTQKHFDQTHIFDIPPFQRPARLAPATTPSTTTSSSAAPACGTTPTRCTAATPTPSSQSAAATPQIRTATSDRGETKKETYSMFHN